MLRNKITNLKTKLMQKNFFHLFPKRILSRIFSPRIYLQLKWGKTNESFRRDERWLKSKFIFFVTFHNFWTILSRSTMITLVEEKSCFGSGRKFSLGFYEILKALLLKRLQNDDLPETTKLTTSKPTSLRGLLIRQDGLHTRHTALGIGF